MDLEYKGKTLENNKRLEDYGILNDCTVNQVKVSLLKVEGINITYEMDCISFDDNENEARAKMPCGHVFSSDSMTLLLKSLINEKKFEIRCPAFINGDGCSGQVCGKPWDYDLCRKIGVLSLGERKAFEIQISQNFIFGAISGQECPVCHNYIYNDSNLIRVACPNCAQQKKGYDFCWKCLKPWKTSGFKICGNLDCMGKIEIQEQLSNCETKTIDQVENVPSIRICPKCEAIIQHANDCKHMECKNCKFEFCFICLKPKLNGSWQCGSYNDPCPIATRQVIKKQ